MPNKRETTLIPVLPSSRSSGVAASKKIKVTSKTKTMTASDRPRPLKPGCAPASRITVAIDPGPAIKGMASGKTDGSSRSSSSSAVSSRRFVRRWNNISSAVSSNKMPPAILNAAIEMPINPNKASPKMAKRANIPAETSVARIAMARLCLTLIPCVRATNKGVRPMGSIMTNSVTKEVMKNAVSIITFPPRPASQARPSTWLLRGHGPP